MPGAAQNQDLTVVGLSGGVDSSLSAWLLHRAGRPVIGMFMKNWEEDDRRGVCAAEADAADAESVARAIGIPFLRRNFSAEYWDCVFEEFLAEYRAGRTPNPDILCNREIKFRTFLEHARDLGAGRIATGHYVRSDAVDGAYRLRRGRDPGKDQSYFLYTLGQEQLAVADFPVGDLTKVEVRSRAREAGLATHAKRDSTGICFIGERDFRGFLSTYLEPSPGEIRTVDERVIGEHQGLMFHTLGQRQGLGLGGIHGFPEAPWYVLHKDLEANVLYVGQDRDHPWLQSRRLRASQASWVSGSAPNPGEMLSAQVRYRQEAQHCTVEAVEKGVLEIRFARPQRAVTPGQSVVLYDEDICLGGGIIDWADAPPSAVTQPHRSTLQETIPS